MTESDRDTLIRHYHSTGDTRSLLELADSELSRAQKLIFEKQLNEQRESVYTHRDLSNAVIFPNGTRIEACPVPESKLLREDRNFLPFAVGVNSKWGLMSSSSQSLGNGDPQSFYAIKHPHIKVPFKRTVVHSTSTGSTQIIEITRGNFEMVQQSFSSLVYGTICISERHSGRQVPKEADVVGPFWEVDKHLASLGIYNEMDDQISLPVLDWCIHLSGSLIKEFLKGESTRTGLVFASQVYGA